MEGYQIAIAILASTLAAFGGMAIVLPTLIKRGIDVSGVLTSTATALDVAETVTAGIETIMGNSPGLDLADRILDYARKGCAAAEQMYKSHQIGGEARKAAAAGVVYDLLAAVGIEVTPEIEKAVAGLIETAMLAMPKTHADAKEDTHA